MSETYVQGSFAFTCSHAEMALIEEAILAGDALMEGCEPADPSPEFLTAFPPVATSDRWSGFRAIFSDPLHPSFGVELEGGNSMDDPGVNIVWIYGKADFQPDPIAALIHRCCRDALAKGAIGFEWACSGSSARLDVFGGGWCAIFANRIEFGTTSEALSHAVKDGAL